MEAIAKLKQQPGRDILVHGSANLVQSLMHADLIDEVQLLVHPVVMGRGKHFFKGEITPMKLKLVETRTFPLGVTLLRYESAKN